MDRNTAIYSCLILGSVFFLGGCSSIAKGVTEALMEGKSEDTRICEITGPSFTGVRHSLDQQGGTAKPHYTKVLMVHGIGKHLPDYSARFREKLTKELGLDTVDASVSKIKLISADPSSGVPTTPLGLLKVSRYASSKTHHELLFYELTWSSITDDAKEVIAFDDSDAYTYRRAGINKSLKAFMNGTVPDVLVYEGPMQSLINKAVGQSLCWMFKAEWGQLPQDGARFCYPDNSLAENMSRDDYFVVTHSLGSRIAIDTINNFSAGQSACVDCRNLASFSEALKNEEITIFMLANQLPFLQVGRPKVGDTGMTAQYCQPSGKHYQDRVVGKTRIVAFSDPNDILSYPVPPDYADDYLDSRMCSEVVNIDINVAAVKSIFGVMDFADPLSAHSGYHEDERTIKIIANGMQHGHLDPLIADRCNWIEVVNSKKPTRKDP